MKTTLSLVALTALAATLTGCCCHECADAAESGSMLGSSSITEGKSASLDAFKRMEGNWTASLPDGGSHTVNYRTIANGSAVVETLFPGTPHEMITVIHEHNGTLMATHYCASKNQPRLVAVDVQPNSITFNRESITNYESTPGTYMGNVTYTFDGPNHAVSTWKGFEKGGKPGHGVVIDMRRM